MATTQPENRPTRQVRPSAKKNTGLSAGTLFTKENHKWMIISGALIVLGYILMSGGKSDDPAKFNKDEVYSFIRITLAPLLILGGLGTFVYAIMKKGTK
jgi:Protein of unknown function (DUF3098)